MTYRELEKLGDVDLLRRTMTGGNDEFHWGWEILVKRYRERLYCFIIRQVKSHADAEDVLQETFIAAAFGIGKFRLGQVRFSTWLFSIAHIRILKLFRRRKIDSGHFTWLKPDDEVPCDGQEAAYWQKVLGHELGRAVCCLPTRRKTIVVLRHRGGRTFDEIAAMLGRSKYWVFTEHRKALTQLRETVPDLAELRKRMQGGPVHLPA